MSRTQIIKDGKKRDLKYSGNYEGNSDGMEGAGLIDALQHFADYIGVMAEIAAFCVDKDSSTTATLNGSALLRNIRISYDPGHVKKSLVKQLKGIFRTRKAYRNLAARMGSRAAWCSSSRRAPEESETAWPDNRSAMKSHFLQEISYLLDHYVLGKCDLTCSTGDCQCKSGGAKK
jgi:hypothetical protein